MLHPLGELVAVQATRLVMTTQLVDDALPVRVAGTDPAALPRPGRSHSWLVLSWSPTGFSRQVTPSLATSGSVVVARRARPRLLRLR